MLICIWGVVQKPRQNLLLFSPCRYGIMVMAVVLSQALRKLPKLGQQVFKPFHYPRWAAHPAFFFLTWSSEKLAPRWLDMVRLLQVRWMVWRTWTEGFSYWVMAMASGGARVRRSVISIANFFFQAVISPFSSPLFSAVVAHDRDARYSVTGKTSRT